LQVLHERLNEKLRQIEEKYGQKLNKVFPGEGKIGIITSGVSFEYAKEALLELGLKPPIAKIVLTHPISKSFVSNFIKDKEAVLVLEELEPILENFVKQIAKEANPNLVIHGKDLLPKSDEYNLERVIPALEKIFGKKFGIDFNDHRKRLTRHRRILLQGSLSFVLVARIGQHSTLSKKFLEMKPSTPETSVVTFSERLTPSTCKILLSAWERASECLMA